MEQIQLYILAFVIKKVWWSHWTMPKNRGGENISWIFFSNNINCVQGACEETSIIATITTPKWKQKLYNILRERKTLAHQLYQYFIIYATIKRKRKEQIMSAVSKRRNNKRVRLTYVGCKVRSACKISSIPLFSILFIFYS